MRTDPEIGLNSQKYSANLQKYGLNTLPEVKPPSQLSILLSQFLNPLVGILIIAAVLTLIVSWLAHDGEVDFTEFIGIMLVVVINGLLGYFQESRAEATLQTLTQTIKPTCIVIRNGRKQEIPTSQLTVGDVVELKLGDKIPADGILLQSSDISSNEAVLTGESEPVLKEKYTDEIDSTRLDKIEDVHNLFMGTSIMSGIGRMQVTKIGIQTRFGKIAESIASQKPAPTPLQVKLERFTQTLTRIILLVSVGIVIWGILQGLDIAEIMELAISIAVSAIPEGMIVALTVILALGMSRILKRKALVRKLLAAETLGSVDTICIDKTGTLTLGQMEVVQTFFNNQDIGVRALLATNHQVNSVEIATLNWARKNMTAVKEAEYKKEQYLDFKIFDSRTKFSATKAEENTYYVGAPEIILSHTNLPQAKMDDWEDKIKDLSIKGMRLIAVGYHKTDAFEFSTKEIPQGIEWIGLVAIEDPVRPNLQKVFAQANAAGITVKVITGDYGETARAVLGKIGTQLNSNEMMSGKELATVSEEQLSDKIEEIKLFYRTTPDQKLRIITNLQNNGHVVGMMGDGINDTPALKKAEIGIVVNNATDFSKEIADMVLIDSNFRIIIAAIEEGRNIFENMRKVVAYLLADAFDAMILVIASLLIGVPVPLLPLQILFINFLADGLPDVALGFEKPEHEVMKEKPKPKDYPLIDSEVRAMIFTIGFVVSGAVMALYLVLLNQQVSETYARTIVFLTVGINSLVYVFSIRSFRKNFWHIDFFSNKLLLFGVAIGMISMIAAAYLPPMQTILSTTTPVITDWLIIFGIAAIDLLLIELIKSVFISKK